MDRTFARDLEIFSESSRSISVESFERLIDKAAVYAEKSLRIHKLELLVQHQIEGDRALIPTIDRGDIYKAYPIHTNGKPNGMNAFAFLTGLPLWIVSADSNEEILAKVTSYRDLWSGVAPDELPHFRRFEAKTRGLEGRENTRTLIAVPVEIGHHVHSVVYFECKDRIYPNERAKKEILMLASSISLIKRKNDVYTDEARRMSKFIGKLEEVATFDDFFCNTPFFFGYSERADKRVVDLIKMALKKHNIPFKDWSLNFETGDIRNKIFTDIMECRAGILYFSEPSAKIDNIQKYIDNVNVIFEAGMLQCRAVKAKLPHHSDAGASFLGWFGVREKNSDSLPFDLAGERIFSVSRLKDGTLLENESEILLDRFLITLLGIGYLDGHNIRL